MTSHIQPEKKCDYCRCPESTATEAGVLCNMTPGKPLHSFQEKTQQPEASWRKQLDTLLWKNIDLRPREESHARPMSIGLADQLENFISQAIAEAIQEERKRIEEAVKGLELTEGFIGPLFNAGHSKALEQVLSVIHPQE